MAEQRLEDRIKEIIVDRLFLTVEPKEIGDDDALMKTLDFDSVKLFDIVVGLEEDFGVSFEGESFAVDDFSTVTRIAACIRRLRGA